METETVVTTTVADTAYGFLIDIGSKTEDLIAWAEAQRAKHFAEVCVRYNGQQKEFGLVEFLSLLGFVGEEVEDGTTGPRVA